MEMALASLYIRGRSRSEGTTKPLSPNKKLSQTLLDPCSSLLEMAEAILFGLATDILENLASFASQKIQLLCDAKDELQSLQHTVQAIQAVLLDAEKQQWHNSQVELWLKRLKDVLYDVQDLLDDVATEDLRRMVTPGNEMWKPVRILFSKSNQRTRYRKVTTKIAHRLNVANKIQELRKNLVEIKNDSKLLHLERHLREKTAAIGRRKKPECLRSPDEKIIGREEDKKRIKQFLFDFSSGQSVSFVAIVGKGGLGKTALALLVYNDGEVQDHFELTLWVCVSDVFDVNSIIKDILRKAKIDCRGHDEEDLPSLLRKTLSGKKYLLVLDDLWNEDRDKWSKLGEWLESGLRGSKILVTTRSRKVGEVTDAKSVIYDLRGLSGDESWNLFKKNAFEEGEESLDLEQEKIGRDLVKKCAGVPLAVRTIGSVFYGKKKHEWRHYEGLKLLEIPEVDEKDDGIMKVLQFSYDHLRSCLKHCFAYCSLFPKDFLYEKDMIIYLWMAQGFIEFDRGKDSVEEVADTYLTELLRGSFLDVETTINGEVTFFKMHDLMHDLAQKVAGGDCKIINFEEGDYHGGIRHASFFSEILYEDKMMSLLQTSKLRTCLYSESADLMWPRSLGSVSEPSVLDCCKVFSELRHCRALILCSKDIPLPPSSFEEKLKHLRFLLISGNRSMRSLSDSIKDLVNLEYLALIGCGKLNKFPRDLRKLIKLRYFLIDHCYSVSHLPPLSELPSLKTLILSYLHSLEFVQQTSDVGQSDTTRPFFPSLERLSLIQCRKLKGWRGTRQVMGEYQRHHRSDNSKSSFPKLRDVRIEHCPDLHFVPSFPQVERLTIWDAKMLEIMPDPNCPSEAAVGSTFTPFSKLKCLHLVGEDLKPSMLKTLLRSANNLEFMSLLNCNIRSFPLGMRHLSSLQELHVYSCEGLNQHDIQWSFLTSLRVLKISPPWNFVQLPEGIQYVNTLQSLEIYNYVQLSSLPEWIGNFSFLEELVLSNCESLERFPFEIICKLKRLKELRIWKCPALKKEDWPPIAHNPVIVWDDELDKSRL